jgi:hypothetical protein
MIMRIAALFLAVAVSGVRIRVHNTEAESVAELPAAASESEPVASEPVASESPSGEAH